MPLRLAGHFLGNQGADRRFLAARRGDVDLLAEAIESGGHDVVAVGTLQAAAKLVG